MEMQHVIKVNNVVCQMVNAKQIVMYGRKKQLHGSKIVENHVVTGRWVSTKVIK